MKSFDVAVIGAGPAGLAAGLASHLCGADTLIIEREDKPGGILKQCIHDGFGLVKFGEKLSGPEYATRYITQVAKENIPILTSTFVTKIEKDNGAFILTLINSKDGLFSVKCAALVLACGCRERTSKQVFIHGSRPAGVYTAGTAQYFVNVLGYLPCKKCIVLGSGDIGLIMARRLTLEGAKVLGVYEIKKEPSGLSRNIVQCLNDFKIPLFLSTTITRIFGSNRVNGVELCNVDDDMNPVIGTEKRMDCDGVILSVGLIPENEIAESLGIGIDPATKGPYVDQNFMTNVDGVFCCGNALHVNDLVDYVSESGELAGKNAAVFSFVRSKTRNLIKIKSEQEKFMYSVPQYIDTNSDNRKAIVYFRSRQTERNVKVTTSYNGKALFSKKYLIIKPPEMERIELDLGNTPLNMGGQIEITICERG